MKKRNFICIIATFAFLLCFLAGCAPKETMSAEELQVMQEKYLEPLIPTGHLYQYGWESANDIKPDDLIDFCAYNNLLNLPTTPEEQTIAAGAEYVQNQAPAEQVETAVQQYFDVDAQRLRESQLYDAGNNTYTMLCGFGGGYGMSLLGARKEGDLLYLQIGEGMFEEEQTVYTGELTVQVIDKDHWKYVSYQKKDGNYPDKADVR